MHYTIPAALLCLLWGNLAIAGDQAAAVHKTSTLKQGKTFERCLNLERGEELSWSFEADGDLRFNIHYHGKEGVRYPVPVSVKSNDTATFAPESDNQYCMMWNNPGTKTVNLNLEYRVGHHQ